VLDKDTDGRGANVVAQATGRPRYGTALELAGFKGRIAYIGIDVGKIGTCSAWLDSIQGTDNHRINRSPWSLGRTIRFMSLNTYLSPLVTVGLAIDDALRAAHVAHRRTTSRLTLN